MKTDRCVISQGENVVKFGVLGVCMPLFGGSVGRGQTLLWDWSYSNSAFSGSGTITTQASGTTVVVDGSQYTGCLATAITGTWFDQLIDAHETIVSLDEPGSLGDNDNVIGDSVPLLSSNGMGFTTSQENIQIYCDAFAGGYDAAGDFGSDNGGSFSANIVAVPEPQRGYLQVLASPACCISTREECNIRWYV